MKRTQIILFAVVVAVALPALAHHAFTAIYHVDQTLMVEGVITEFRFVNPHARIYLDVENEDGSVVNWMAEGGTPNVLVRQGWTGDEFAPGEHVAIFGNPAKNGTNVIHWIRITRENGVVMFGEDVDFQGIDRRRR